jgi:hypothetical protein
MKIPGVFLLLVGCVWAIFVVWMFLTLAGIANFEWSPSGVLYWMGMLIGPLSLIVGSALVLRDASGRLGAVLVAIGCLVLTVFAVYNSFAATQRKPLQAPPPYLFCALMLAIMLFADVAGFRVVKQLLTSGSQRVNFR